MQFEERATGPGATANLRFFLPVTILLVALAIAGFASKNPWSVTLAYNVFGPLTGPIVYIGFLFVFFINANIIWNKNRYMSFDGQNIKILGYKNIPIDQIISVKSIKDWRGVKKLVIVQKSTTSYVTSFKFNESLEDVQRAISLLPNIASARAEVWKQ
jgi:hypothetical protein